MRARLPDAPTRPGSRLLPSLPGPGTQAASFRPPSPLTLARAPRLCLHTHPPTHRPLPRRRTSARGQPSTGLAFRSTDWRSSCSLSEVRTVRTVTYRGPRPYFPRSPGRLSQNAARNDGSASWVCCPTSPASAVDSASHFRGVAPQELCEERKLVFSAGSLTQLLL